MHSGTNHELIARLVNAEMHMAVRASATFAGAQADARGAPPSCTSCAHRQNFSQTSPSASSAASGSGIREATLGASFKRCGWKAVITADNRRELLSVRLKDSWERDLLPAQSA